MSRPWPFALLVPGFLAAACNGPIVRPVPPSGGAMATGGGEASGGIDGNPGFGGFPDAGASSDSAASQETPACAATSQAAMAVPLDVFFLVDTSGSMSDAFGNQTKWQMVRTALNTFAGDPSSVGLGAGLEFFPLLRTCTANAECQAGGVDPTISCATRNKCVQQNQVFDDCDTTADCFGLGTCKPIGNCAASGANCANPGGNCRAGDPCVPQPKVCGGRLQVTDPATCDANHYAMPDVPIAPLPANGALVSAALQQKSPLGSTPMQAAITGALKYLGTYLAATPDHKAVLVLATDGEPNGCDDDDMITIGAVAAASKGAPSIATYAIGVFPPDPFGGNAAPPLLDEIAAAGGTGKALVLDPAKDLTKTFLAALEQIRGAALPCAFPIPASQMGAIDYHKVNFHADLTSGPQDLSYAGNAAGCDPTRGGWYYNVDPDAGQPPTQVMLCDASCKAIKADRRAKVSLRFGCRTVVIL
jgi:hypothetical protein